MEWREIGRLPGQGSIGRVGFTAGGIKAMADDCMEGRVDTLDVTDMSLDHLAGRHPSRTDHGSQIDGRPKTESIHGDEDGTIGATQRVPSHVA